MAPRTLDDPAQLAEAAARDAAARIRETIVMRGRARIVAATGASQIAFLERLINEPGIDWLLKNRASVQHYFHQLAVDGQL